MTTWSPIETAPIREFSPANWYMPHSANVLVWNGHYVTIASYHYTKLGKGKWRADGRIISGITHWMSLPEPPNV